MATVTTSEIVLTLIIVVFIVSLVVQRMNEVASVKSSIDGRRYIVRNLPDKQQAADLIASINKDITGLIDYLKSTNPGDKDVRRLARNFNPSHVSEASDKMGYTSYTIEKGEKIVLCIRKKDEKNTIHERNLVMYVFLHELAHCMTSGIGHTPEFWENNKRILEAAVKTHIYRKVDYSKKPAEYCGIKLSTSVI